MVTSNRSSWPRWARALTTGWVVSPLIVIALILVSFEGYGFYTRHQKTTYARGGAFGVSGLQRVASHGGKRPAKGKPTGKHTTTHAPHGAGHKSSVQASGKTKTGVDNATSPTASHSPTASQPSHSSSSSPSPTPSAASPALVTPQSGRYVLAVSGSESAKFGPLSACKNNFPSRATLDVHHATGESPTSYDFDMRMYPGSPNKHDERHIYTYSKSAVVLGYEQETVTCSGIKQSSAVTYSPDQTRVELPLAVGNTWHNHGGGSARTETGTSQVVAHTSVTVQGKSYSVYEIATKLTMTGSETGERDQTWWYSPTLGVPLKFAESLHGKRSGADYSENYTATVISLP